METSLELYLQNNRDGRLLADSFTILVPNDQPWHGATVAVYYRGSNLGSCRVTMATRFFAERLTDQNAMVALGMSKMKTTQTYMLEFGDIAPTTHVCYVTLEWMSRDLTAFGPLFNAQWSKLVEEKESQIQTAGI
jgi:hypothetical protein